jgi:hypothetical protein
MAALVVLTATWWWRGDTGGVIWDPATGPPTDSLRDLTDLVRTRAVMSTVP